MNKARAMLDALMGPQRDEKQDKGKSKEKFKEKEVCKCYLIGLCPFDAGYLGGKRNFTVCSKIHSEMMREQFKAHGDFRKLNAIYEEEALHDFQYAVRECDGRVASEKKRIAEDWGNRRKPLAPEVMQQVNFMRKAHRVRMEEAEALDDDHYQDKIRLMKEADELAKEANAYEEKELQKAKDAAIPEEVCETCGTSYHGTAGNAAHKAFKIHGAYQEIRDKMAQLEESVKKARDEGRKAAAEGRDAGDGNREEESGAREGRRGEPKDAGNDGRRDRDRSKDRKRGGRDSRSRGRGDKGRDRGGRGGRGRDSRSRSGGGGKAREAPRGRARDSRSRGGGGGGGRRR